jgi:hypothetical protein
MKVLGISDEITVCEKCGEYDRRKIDWKKIAGMDE